MFQIHIRNFQSIENASLTVDGFSVLVGRSNIGKSAIVRAVKAALTGAPASSYVKHGLECQRRVKGSKTCKCYCSVHIKTQGVDLLWEKGDSVNRYVYNGKDYSVVGRGYPEFLGDAFSPLEIGTEKVPLHIFDQFKPLFLLDSSGSAAADTLSDVAGLDKINIAATQAEKDRKECNAVRKIRDSDLKKVLASIVTLDSVPHIEELVTLGYRHQEQVNALTKDENKLLSFVADIETLEGRVEILTKLSEVALPDFFDPSDKIKALLNIERWLPQLQKLVLTLKSLKACESIVLQELTSFEEHLKAERLTQWHRQLDFLNSTVHQHELALDVKLLKNDLIVPAKEHEKVSAWVTQLKSLKEFFSKYKQLEGLTLQALPTINPSMASQLDVWISGSQNLKSKIKNLEEELRLSLLAEQEAKEELDTCDICPTCQQPLPKANDHALLHISH